MDHSPDDDVYLDTTAPAIITPKVKGRFALFDTPDGGLHVAYRPDGDEEDQHFEVPGHVLKLARMMQEGSLNPMDMIKMFRGGGGDD